MKKVLILVGTRPEAIKMAPVYKELKSHPFFNPILVSTGQHKEMLSQALADFELSPDINLNIMTVGQTLSSMSAKLFESLDNLFAELQPDIILVQGDTTTVQVASLVAFYRNILIGHVEAGLRSNDIHSPFPEELNRKVTGLVATWHFAPTQKAKQNLLKEGIDPNRVIVSGNTVIDSLLWMRNELRINPPTLPSDVASFLNTEDKIILVTGHRRESFGEGFENICSAIENIANEFSNIRIIYPVHLNPNVKKVVESRLSNHPRILLTNPLTYKPFVYLMDKSYLIMSDSGGIQEEAPSLGKPVLVMRNVTERPEGIEAGVNFLVGTSKQKIFEMAREFLMDEEKYSQIQAIKSPFGDGKAATYIANFLTQKLLSSNEK